VRTLEIIHLRQTGEDLQGLLELVRKSMDLEPDPIEVRIYRHTKLETDLAIHLHRETLGGADGASSLGLRLAWVLREHGMVEHSHWIEGRRP
jgi:hypothetical protein